jgi:hypothetical protein
MDEKTMEQITDSTQRLVAAAEALQNALMVINAQQQDISAKVDRIVAAIEEKHEVRSSMAEGKPTSSQILVTRKTLSPLVTSILAKNGVEEGSDTGLLDKALAALSPEQRIAVKLEMARAGVIQ